MKEENDYSRELYLMPTHLFNKCIWPCIMPGRVLRESKILLLKLYILQTLEVYTFPKHQL